MAGTFHEFTFEGWGGEDVEREKQHPDDQIRYVAQKLFQGVWAACDPCACTVKMPFGIYTFNAQRDPIMISRTTAYSRAELLDIKKRVEAFHKRGDRPLICGFLKVRNEVIREGNIYRCLENLRRFCDVIVGCDDASTDGTAEILKHEVDYFMEVLPEEQDFCKEMIVKRRMLQLVHDEVRPYWIYWADADEELSEAGCHDIRAFCEKEAHGTNEAFRFHYTQLWRNADYARTDDGFDDGKFTKLWRWSPGLYFDTPYGTHRQQVPRPILDRNLIADAPWEVIHWGNFGKNLVWKCIQYWGGLGGVERHMHFENARYRPVSVEAHLGAADFPCPFNDKEKRLILQMHNLEGVAETFAVIIPTYNRAKYLPQTLASVRGQTYEKWIAIVIDDGSTDETPQVMRRWQDLDPRIFYVRFSKHRGGVAVNETGMAMACHMTEWWTRLGSDDYFEPHKLELDAKALRCKEACYGPYRVLRGNSLDELCNEPLHIGDIQARLLSGQFVVSWANVAVATVALKRVRLKFGNFCDPALVNMEDFLVNARLATVTEFLFRGMRTDGSVHLGRPDDWPSTFMHDAVWRCNPVGASADVLLTGNDDVLTKKLIQGMPITVLDPKSFWKVASTFSADKESVYPDHAEASGFDDLHGLDVLEYGCGGGSDTMSLLRRGNRVTYCDIVQENVLVATKRISEQKLAGATPCLLQTSLLTPIPDASFDVVYSHGVLHHIEDVEPVLRDIYRVLRHGGLFIVMFYSEHLERLHADGVKARVDLGLTYEQAFGAMTDGLGCPYARAYTEEQGKALFERVGFSFERARLYNADMFRVFFSRKP